MRARVFVCDGHGHGVVEGTAARAWGGIVEASMQGHTPADEVAGDLHQQLARVVGACVHEGVQRQGHLRPVRLVGDIVRDVVRLVGDVMGCSLITMPRCWPPVGGSSCKSVRGVL